MPDDADFQRLIRYLGFATLLAIAGSARDLHAANVHSQVTPPTAGAPSTTGHAQAQLLVRFKDGASPLVRQKSHAAVGASSVRRFRTVPDLELVNVGPGRSLESAIDAYRKRPDVLYAEPNYRLHALGVPNDPRWAELWNLENTGQENGQPDADIDAPAAWDLTRGSRDVVVVVIDTGIEYRHADLAANVWSNPADCDGDGRDDDGNGWVDDCHGIDTVNGDSDPLDDFGHGTHVAGTIGAVGDNGVGVTGVNQAVSIAACKFLDAYGYGYTDGAIACLDWVAGLRDRAIRVVATNNSWGGGGFSQGLAEAIEAQRQRGVLFIAAAGNYGSDIDLFPQYPAAYDGANIIAVAATDRHDDRAWFSNVGRRSVDVGAPGVDVLSTVPGDQYEVNSGTSMATPHVTGLAALLAAAEPTRDWAAIRNLILTSGDDLPALAATVTGKRINAQRALTCVDAPLTARVAPATDEVRAQIGVPIPLAVLHLRCADPAGPVSVVVSPDGVGVELRDDGVGPDQAAGDGTYSGSWTPESEGTRTLTFPGGDTASVRIDEGSDYRVRRAAFAWREIGGTSLELGDDGFAAIAAAFPIQFGGAAYDILYVSSNGLVSFDQPVTRYENETMPVPDIQTIVAPFWDDLLPIPGNESNVFVESRGTEPHRELVVEWRNVESLHYCPSDATVRFQVVFSEDRPDVLFNYLDVASDAGCDLAAGASATVGLQTAADRATVYSFDTPALQDGMTLLWTLEGTGGCLTDSDCDDGLDCTVDQCVSGACVQVPDDSHCPPAGPCTSGVCDPTAGCVVVWNPECPACDGDIDCDDGVSCTADRCLDGLCEHAPDDTRCGSGCACARGVCDPVADCVEVPDPTCVDCDEDADCDDGLPCTIDRCVASVCRNTPDDARCDDGDACTLDRCDALRSCEPAADTCPPPSCTDVRDPAAVVQVDARRGKARLRARLTALLNGGFTGAPVTVSLRGADGNLIASQAVTRFRHLGHRFVFRSSRPGLQRLAIKPIAAGRVRLTIDARRFFQSAAQLAGSVMLELRIGDVACLQHPVTRALVGGGARAGRSESHRTIVP